MELKAIIYIIGGVLYFFYFLNKKARESKNKNQQPPVVDDVPVPQKPVSPPAAKSLKEVMQEAKKIQADYDAQKRRIAEVSKSPKPVKQDTLIRDLEKRGVQEIEMEKQTSPPMVAAEINEMDLLHADSYKHKEEETTGYEIDARKAFIGSIIFEQKF